jgi:phosphoglycolate phosphatase-like HAD superfamily hydrolase
VKLFLFDVDMTLVSTGGAGLRALDRACRKLLSIQNAMEGIDPSGKTDPAIVREIFARWGTTRTVDAGVSIETVLESYLSFLREEVEKSEKYHVLPGITAILDHISAHAHSMLGLATGNIELGARVKLERGNLNRYFTFGGFGSDSENRTQLVKAAAEKAVQKSGKAIRPDDVFVIGDTPLDIDAGRDAGYRTVGVATGRYSTSQLQNAGATFVISDFHKERHHFIRLTLS